jgi:hypothetical protein
VGRLYQAFGDADDSCVTVTVGGTSTQFPAASRYFPDGHPAAGGAAGSETDV